MSRLSQEVIDPIDDLLVKLAASLVQGCTPRGCSSRHQVEGVRAMTAASAGTST